MTVTEAVRRATDSLSPRERGVLAAMAGTVALLLGLGTGLLLLANAHHFRLTHGTVFGLGTGLLALTLGMRHAFDADHIAAIDNTTRKLMAEGRRPLSVGFFFSLGHSTVVLVLAVLLNLGVKALNLQVSQASSGLHQVTGIIGTSVSSGFLYLIAALNLVILAGIIRTFRKMRDGRYSEEELEAMLANRGALMRFLGPLARSIDAPWKMYPLGLLFGLGFDTATEIALLVLSGSAVVGGLPLWAILSLPLLFAGGMCLLDTLDGCFMNFAYEWAFSQPVRKVYYNLVITVLSVTVALLVGTIELLGLLGEQLDLHGGIWDLTARFNANAVGLLVATIFAVTWLVAVLAWRWGRLEHRYAPARQEG